MKLWQLNVTLDPRSIQVWKKNVNYRIDEIWINSDRLVSIVLLLISWLCELYYGGKMSAIWEAGWKVHRSFLFKSDIFQNKILKKLHTHTPAHKMWKCWAGCFEMECKHISEKEGGHGLPISQCQTAIPRFLKEGFLLSLLRTVNICRICVWPVILFYSSLRFGGHVWKSQWLLWLMVSLKMLYVDAWGI